jgi:predicted AlkP superfamily pyrophosphatase or phosphodiesterase
VANILLAPHDHFACWRKADIPAAFHYGSHPRIPAFVCLNQEGWRFITAEDAATKKKQNPGNHGFDPHLPDMQAVFIGHGPAFRQGVTLPAFDNVDVYPLLARLAGVRAEKNDGNPATLAAALSP